MSNSKDHLNVMNLGLSLGITWALAMFLLGIVSWLFNWGTDMVQMFSSLYIGYTDTFMGSVVGALWGFVDCFIAGVIIAWIYNKLSKNTN